MFQELETLKKENEDMAIKIQRIKRENDSLNVQVGKLNTL